MSGGKMSILDKMQEDSAPDVKVDDLSNISELARQLEEVEDKIRLEEEVLSELKAERKNHSEGLLPDALQESGLSEIKLSNGTTLSVSTYYTAKITDDNKDAAFKWLVENNLGDIIKNTVTANFNRTEDARATELMTQLEGEGHDLVQKKWVEPMTLKATVKEQVERGTDLPLDTFNVYVGHKIKVKK